MPHSSVFFSALLVFSCSFVAGCAPATQAAGHSKQATSEPTPRANASAAEPRVEGHLKKNLPPPQASEENGEPVLKSSSTNSPTLKNSGPQEGIASSRQAPPQVIGKEGLLSLEAWGKTGAWVAYCQKTTLGQSQTNKLKFEAASHQLFMHWGKEITPIDALLRHDKSGQYVVVQQKENTWLVDAFAGKRWSLSEFSPDLRADALPDHRSFAFADQGLILLSDSPDSPDSPDSRGYFIPFPLPERESTSLLPLARKVDWGPRPPWRVHGGVGFLSATTLAPKSTSKSWPIPLVKTAIHRCMAQGTAYPAYHRLSAYRRDRHLETTWLKLPPADSPLTRKLRPQLAPGYVMGTNDGWVRREDSGRLLLVKNHTQKQITSARCGARIHHMNRKNGLFLVSCEEYKPIIKKRKKSKRKSRSRKKAKYRFDLYLVRPGFVRNLHGDVARTGVDILGNSADVLLPLRPGANAALVDFSRRTLITLSPSTYVLSTGRSHALVRRGENLFLWSRTGEQRVHVQLDPLAKVLSAGRAIALDSQVFLLGDDLTSWRLERPPLALSQAGYALVPEKWGNLNRWVHGPLRLVPPPASTKTSASPLSPQ